MMREMFRFATVLLVVMLGFTLSFHALFRADDTYGTTCLNLFKAMLGEVGLFDEISGDEYENRYEPVATLLLVVYLVVITIVLLNLLIAVLSTSHTKVDQHADREYKVLKAHLIKHYRFFVREDLLPAPFNLVQLPFRGHDGAKRGVGILVFWLIVGPVAVVGGSFLWVVSAFCVYLRLPRVPATPLPWMASRFVLYVVCCCAHYSPVVDQLLLFVWRAVGCPLHLLGWWLTRPIAGVGRVLFCGLCGPEIGTADHPKARDAPSVDDILRKKREPLVNELLQYLENPMSDAKVREDEKTKATTVEHMKLLRNHLEEAIQATDLKMERKVDRTAKALDERLNDKVDNLRNVMDRRLDGIVELIKQQQRASRGRAASR